MARRPPDIVLLVLDTRRVDRFACFGAPTRTSPNLDAFARECTRFAWAIAPAQWSIPAHASLFTGEYPSVHGMFQTTSVLADALPTLAERLRDGGYFTAAFCNNPLVGVVNNGLRRGFQSFLNYVGLITTHPNQAGPQSGLLDKYRQWFKRKFAEFVSSAQGVVANSERLTELSFTPLFFPIWQAALSLKGNSARSLSDAARLLIRREGLSPRQPVFCFINLMDTHMPYHAPRRLVERFAPQFFRNRELQAYLRRFNSDAFGWLAPLEDEIAPEHKALLDGMYDAQAAWQDEMVGAFFDRLRASGALERALFIVTSDHGEHLGERQLVGHTISLYNELIHVPLLVRDPTGEFAPGTCVNHFVSSRRLFHTALAAAGIASPVERALSLVNVGANDPEQGEAFSEAVLPLNVQHMLIRRKPELARRRGADRRRIAVCSERYKLIQTGADHFELYDLSRDPGETENLCDQLPARVEALRERLRAFALQQSGRQATEQAVTSDDPLVLNRLRDLGYLE
ncbi:MAG: sulfatase [Candidatus Roseilinea sp.]|nr:MAG: sulfatase [Candidatus Roseilinea sp.]